MPIKETHYLKELTLIDGLGSFFFTYYTELLKEGRCYIHTNYLTDIQEGSYRNHVPHIAASYSFDTVIIMDYFCGQGTAIGRVRPFVSRFAFEATDLRS